MKILLAALGASLIALAFPGATLSPTHPLVLRANAGAEVVAAEVPLVFPDLSPAEQEKRGRIAMVWGFREAAWQSDPKGSNDAGGACGWGQVHVASLPKGLLPPEMTCVAIRADLRTSVRAHLLVMRYLEQKCGSLRSAMTAYATGACPKPGYTIPLVLRRFAEAGLAKGT